MKKGLKFGFTLGLLSCVALTACTSSGRGTDDITEFSTETSDDTFLEPWESAENTNPTLSERAGSPTLSADDTLTEDIALDATEPQLDVAAANGPSIAQIKRLEENGLPTVLPSKVPAGFDFADFEVTSGSLGIYYDATYKGENNCGFDVNGATGGWGAPLPIKQWTVQTPLFGEVVLEEYESEVEENYLLATIIPSPDFGKVIISDYPKAGYIIGFRCEYAPFNPEQAAEILTLMEVIN